MMSTGQSAIERKCMIEPRFPDPWQVQTLPILSASVIGAPPIFQFAKSVT